MSENYKNSDRYIPQTEGDVDAAMAEMRKKLRLAHNEADKYKKQLQELQAKADAFGQLRLLADKYNCVTIESEKTHYAVYCGTKDELCDVDLIKAIDKAHSNLLPRGQLCDFCGYLLPNHEDRCVHKPVIL